MTCKNCGANLDSNAKFCISCGTPVPPPEKKKKKKAPIIIAIAVVLVLALVAGGVASLAGFAEWHLDLFGVSDSCIKNLF